MPWEELVERVQGLQDIALRTIKTSTDIFFESIKSGTKAMRSTAKMVEQSSDDLEAKPQLAGPVFEELLTIRVTAGQPPGRPNRWEIQHASLTRLRIHAIVPAPGAQAAPGARPAIRTSHAEGQVGQLRADREGRE